MSLKIFRFFLKFFYTLNYEYAEISSCIHFFLSTLCFNFVFHLVWYDMFFETGVSKGMQAGALAAIGERHRFLLSMLNSPVLTNEVWILSYIYYTHFLKSGTHYTGFSGLNFSSNSRLTWNLERHTCLRPPNSESTDVFYYTLSWIFNSLVNIWSFFHVTK